MVEASKNSMRIPDSLEDMLIVIEGFKGLTTILFGGKSSLPIGLRGLCQAVAQYKLMIKGKISSNPSLIAKIMYIVDSRTQLWLSCLQKAADREDVNDEIINFASTIDDIVLDKFNVVLPPVFTLTKVEKDEEDEQPKKKKKKKVDKSGDDVGDRKAINKNVPSEFKLLEGESYKKVFAHNNIKERPKWKGDRTMCTRWWTHGICYTDCRNAESHVPTSELPADRKQAFIEFLEVARRA